MILQLETQETEAVSSVVVELVTRLGWRGAVELAISQAVSPSNFASERRFWKAAAERISHAMPWDA